MQQQADDEEREDVVIQLEHDRRARVATSVPR